MKLEIKITTRYVECPPEKELAFREAIRLIHGILDEVVAQNRHPDAESELRVDENVFLTACETINMLQLANLNNSR